MRQIRMGQYLFTDAEDAFIKEHYQDMSDEEIAEAMAEKGFPKRNAMSVTNRRSYLCLKRKKRLSINDVRQLANEGMSAKQIANELGFSNQRISQFCQEQGIKIKKRNERR